MNSRPLVLNSDLSQRLKNISDDGNLGWKQNPVKNYFVNTIKVVDSINPDSFIDENDVGVIPTWIKTFAGWWADEKISNNEFLGEIEFMIKTCVLSFEVSNNMNYVYKTSKIPGWIKNNAKWCSMGLIVWDDFVRSV